MISHSVDGTGEPRRHHGGRVGMAGLVMLMGCTLAGCGQKGALRLPDAQPAPAASTGASAVGAPAATPNSAASAGTR